MNDVATYVLVSALITVPAIGFVPEVREALFALYRMSTATIGTPWP